MTKADKMFLDIGFKKEQEYELRYINDSYVEIDFDLINETYCVHCLGRMIDIDTELHNAIHQQMKELGWIE